MFKKFVRIIISNNGIKLYEMHKNSLVNRDISKDSTCGTHQC